MTLTLTLNLTLNDIRRSLSVIHTDTSFFSSRERRSPPFFAYERHRNCLSNCLVEISLSALILIINPRARSACLCVTPCPSRLLLASVSSARFPRCVGFLGGRKRVLFLFFGDDGRARLWRRRQSRRAMMMSQSRRREEERRDGSTQSRKKRSRTSS